MSESPSPPAVSLVAGIVLLACLLAGCGTTSGSSQPKDASSAQRSGDSSQSAGPAVFDLGRDFSFTANPNGPWRYGFTRGTQLNLAAFVPDATSVATSPVGFWHAGPASAGYYPYIAANTSSSTVWDPTHSWPVRAHEVALEASASGQFAVVEFIVPRAGSYEIAADFAGVHKHLSTTDAHVLLNDDSLFSATILGYGGDPAFLPRQGASPTASFHATRALRAGDVLSFAIGYGPNHTHFDDTTGLILTIRAVS